jgi:hypothetical protein
MKQRVAFQQIAITIEDLAAYGGVASGAWRST